MIVNRHKLALQKLGINIGGFSVESVKIILIFFVTFVITAFFGYQMIAALNKGIETRARTDIVSKQVEALRAENERLKQEREMVKSETEIERQLRAMGYQRPGDKVFVVSSNEDDKGFETEEITVDSGSEDKKLTPWLEWSNILFRKI